jgi:hypothetical protein
MFCEEPIQRHDQLILDEGRLHIENLRSESLDDCDEDTGDNLGELFLRAAIIPTRNNSSTSR